MPCALHRCKLCGSNLTPACKETAAQPKGAILKWLDTRLKTKHLRSCMMRTRDM